MIGSSYWSCATASSINLNPYTYLPTPPFNYLSAYQNIAVTWSGLPVVSIVCFKCGNPTTISNSYPIGAQTLAMKYCEKCKQKLFEIDDVDVVLSREFTREDMSKIYKGYIY